MVVVGWRGSAIALIVVLITATCTETPATPSAVPSASAAVATASAPVAAPPKNTSPFSVTYAAPLPPSSLTADYLAGTMKAASELGAKSLRWNVLWQAFEISDGRFDWSLSDRIVQAADASHIELVLLVNGYSPDPRRTNVRNLYPAGGDQKLRAYESFLREFVHRYQGRVRYWQIENEVTDPQYWASSPDDYISVLSTAYRVIKSEDKNATVLMAGLAADVAKPAQDRFLLERGRDSFDILDVHLYFPPEELRGKISGVRTEMKTIGYDKPIWVTETGGPHPCNVRSAQEPPPERQSSEVVERYVELLSAGVERVFWFGLQRDTTPVWGCRPGSDDSFNFMMLVRGQQRRPAFSTYQLMVQKLEGSTAVEPVNMGEGVSAFRFSLRSGPVVVVWADKDRTVSLAGTAGDVTVTDILGRASRVNAGAIPASTTPLFIEMIR